MKKAQTIFTAAKNMKHEKKKSSLMSTILSTSGIIIFCFILLALAIRGLPGNPTSTQLNTPYWRDEGPFELSPERGRYALLYSVVEDKSFQFSEELAAWTHPDIAITEDGKYVSLFAPGVSFLVAPGYFLGKHLGYAQLGTFAVVGLFAVLNVLLIRAIAIRLAVNPTAATLGAFAFLFASPAFAYAVTVYQHHISTFLILMSIYILLRWKSALALAAIWFLCAASIPIDYPNLFLMFPIGVYAAARFFSVRKAGGTYAVKIRLASFLTVITVVIPISLFLLFNSVSYNNPFQLSGTLKTIEQAKLEQELKKDPETYKQYEEAFKKNAVGFFKTRVIMNGLYTQIFSLDRGVIVFTPIMLLGFVGIYFAVGENKKIYAVMFAVIGSNVLLYAMWGDPYGGWAFGSRYLIPTYALMAIFIAVGLSHLRKNNLYLLLFFMMLTYSVSVNTLGAVTSNQNPPQVEIDHLQKVTKRVEKYTYERNVDALLANKSKSFVFQTVGHNYMSAFDYYMRLTAVIVSVAGWLLIVLRVRAQKEYI